MTSCRNEKGVGRRLDHHCSKCIAFDRKERDSYFIQAFLDGIKSYFVTSSSYLLKDKKEP